MCSSVTFDKLAKVREFFKVMKRILVKDLKCFDSLLDAKTVTATKKTCDNDR